MVTQLKNLAHLLRVILPTFCLFNTVFFQNNILQLYYLGNVLDLENRPVKGAIITDESSSSFSNSDTSGFYKLAVGEGKLLIVYFTLDCTINKFKGSRNG